MRMHCRVVALRTESIKHMTYWCHRRNAMRSLGTAQKKKKNTENRLCTRPATPSYSHLLFRHLPIANRPKSLGQQRHTAVCMDCLAGHLAATTDSNWFIVADRLHIKHLTFSVLTQRLVTMTIGNWLKSKWEYEGVSGRVHKHRRNGSRWLFLREMNRRVHVVWQAVVRLLKWTPRNRLSCTFIASCSHKNMPFINKKEWKEWLLRHPREIGFFFFFFSFLFLSSVGRSKCVAQCFFTFSVRKTRCCFKV